MITVADKLSHRHGISMLFSDARFRVINLQFKHDGEGVGGCGGGGLERPTKSIQSRERKHCLKITPTLILELSVKIRVFCICVGDSIPLKDKAVPVNSNKLFYLCCVLYLFRWWSKNGALDRRKFKGLSDSKL